MSRSREARGRTEATRRRVEQAIKRAFATTNLGAARRVDVARPTHVVTAINTGRPNSTQVAGAAQRVQIRQTGGHSSKEADHGQGPR